MGSFTAGAAPGFPPGARDRLGQSQTPSIKSSSVLSARRFALLAESCFSLSEQPLPVMLAAACETDPRVLRLAMGPKASC